MNGVAIKCLVFQFKFRFTATDLLKKNAALFREPSFFAENLIQTAEKFFGRAVIFFKCKRQASCFFLNRFSCLQICENICTTERVNSLFWITNYD